MPKIAFYTLGCKVNSYETEALKELFLEKGYEISDFDEVCDVYVINSCAVTAVGEKKSRQAVSRARRKNPKATVALIGCYAQRLSEKEFKDIEADIILGNGEKSKLCNLIEEKAEKMPSDDVYSYPEFEEMSITGACSDRLRGYIKIQDGCNRFCSYCIIPYVRGKVRSRNLRSIENEAKALAESGICEIVLTGIQVGAYGDDFKDGTKLIDAIECASKAKNLKRLRLSSIEPVAITEEFLTRLKAIPAFCPHFHLSLQSGCDKILEAMNRRYTSAEYLEKVNLIRKFFPDAGITTDIIAGFPGETEEDFAETLKFSEMCGFSKIHAFPYSPREGTKAAKLPDLPKKSVRSDRAKRLIELSGKLHKKFAESMSGKAHKVYFEQYKDGKNYGYTENYLYVSFPSDKDLTGSIKEIVLTPDMAEEISE